MRTFVFILLFLFSLVAKGQLENPISVEVGANGIYNYYIANDDIQPGFNYGFTIAAFTTVSNWFEVGLGVGFNTNNYTEWNVNRTNSKGKVVKRFYSSNIQEIQLRFNFLMHETQNWKYSLTGGLAYLGVTNVSADNYYENGMLETDVKVGNKPFLTAIQPDFGIRVERVIHGNWVMVSWVKASMPLPAQIKPSNHFGIESIFMEQYFSSFNAFLGVRYQFSGNLRTH